MNVDKLAGKYEHLKRKTRNHSFITLKDNKMIEVECCRRVDKFEDNLIELSVPCGVVRIIGLNLKLKNFGYDCVKIKGVIHSIGFEQDICEKTEDI